MLKYLHMRISSISGGGDGEGYGVFGGPFVDAGVMMVVFCVVAASVVVWEACAFAAMAALLLGAAWCLVASWTGRRRAATTAPAVPAAAAAAAEAGVGGLTDAAIEDALPASPYDGSRRGGVDATCSVCLEDVRGGEMVRSLPQCRHLFHAGCIDVWLRSHATCPLCRSDVSVSPQRRVTAAAELSPA